ncbi:101 kDa malaria antigen-like isoform X2 [Macadamia integrifolia]|nr:101 kDa malaria antigen-like isoform X2 [Macadamia integrifolia]
MVCTLGKGRMAAMVRLLETGNFSEITAEEASHEKLAVQSIHREFREADEANLLEEEDMHVFDCKPLADPLHLVCCYACKKPVKASQYAAHAGTVMPVQPQNASTKKKKKKKKKKEEEEEEKKKQERAKEEEQK